MLRFTYKCGTWSSCIISVIVFGLILGFEPHAALPALAFLGFGVAIAGLLSISGSYHSIEHNFENSSADETPTEIPLQVITNPKTPLLTNTNNSAGYGTSDTAPREQQPTDPSHELTL